jgi:L-arabinose isomerase
MGNRFRMVVNEVDIIQPEKPLSKLPVASVVWVPQPNLKVAANGWILAGGAHHTGFSQSVTTQHLEDFAEMAGMEFLVIDNNTDLANLKKELRWNDMYYLLAKGL